MERFCGAKFTTVGPGQGQNPSPDQLVPYKNGGTSLPFFGVFSFSSVFCGWCRVLCGWFCRFFVYFYGMKTLECIGIPGFFGGFILLAVSAFG